MKGHFLIPFNIVNSFQVNFGLARQQPEEAFAGMKCPDFMIFYAMYAILCQLDFFMTTYAFL